MKLKDLSQQTIVLTGATSGIGLVTARMAAERGANLVLVARSESALQQLTSELRMKGNRVEYVVADVADESQLRRAAVVAQQRFGGFDTWINDAGVLIFGRNDEVPVEDKRRLFETNFWGVVNGSKDNLYQPLNRLRERQGSNHRVSNWSAYTMAAMYPRTALLIAGALGLVGLAVVYRTSLHRTVRRVHPVAMARLMTRQPL